MNLVLIEIIDDGQGLALFVITDQHQHRLPPKTIYEVGAYAQLMVIIRVMGKKYQGCFNGFSLDFLALA